MPTDIQFDTLSDELLSQAIDLLPEWAPGGKVRGNEYVASTIHGGEGDSFSLNLGSGAWSDFASGEKGGDLVSLWACQKQISQSKAYEELGGKPGPQNKKVQDLELGVPPADAPTPVELDGSSAVYTYRSEDGAPLFYIARFDREDGKTFTPVSWSSSMKRWVKKAWPKNRPMYGLAGLSARPDDPVLVVEGEKAANAAMALMGQVYVVVTWHGGCNAIKKTNWRPLKDRDVVIWPDQDLKRATRDDDVKGLKKGEVIPYPDQPGVKAADAVVEHLIQAKAKGIKIVDVGGVSEIDGWDLADAKDEGWDWPRIAEWARPRVRSMDLEPKPQVIDEKQDKIFASKYDIWKHIGLSLNARGTVDKTLLSATIAIANWEPLKGKIWYDEFHDKVFTTLHGDRHEWGDADTLMLTRYFQEILGLQFNDDLIYKALRLHSYEHKRNEPLEWLESLQWDGQERIDLMLADAFGTPVDIYTTTISKNFMMTMVARIVRPGCKVDNMVVLEGKQGAFKSTALSIIGGEWYTEMTESINSKDFFLALQGKILVEIAELDSFGKADTTRIKQTITNQVDRYRKPYGRETQDFPRRCIFVGTTNDDEYLRDSTGGRRFWPVACNNIDLAVLRRDRDQYFAEAYHLLIQGGATATWWEVPEKETEAVQEARRHADSWEDLIHDWILSREPYLRTDIKPIDVLGDCLKLEPGKQDTRASMRVGKVMRRLGYKGELRWDLDTKKTTRFYVLIKDTDD